MKSRQISNILAHGFLSKCEKRLHFANGPIKSAVKTIKTLSWNYKALLHQIILNSEIDRQSNVRLKGFGQPKRVKFTNSVIFVPHPHFMM